MTPRRKVQTYLFEQHAPLWLEAGWDRTLGGFHERLSPTLQPIDTGFQRLTVQCRQIYTHAQVFMLTGKPEYAHRALAGFQHLEARFRDPEHGGWYFKINERGGEPVDSTKDTYAHAFVLFALAYLHRATRDGDVQASLDHGIEVVTSRLAEPRYGGCVESMDASFTSAPTGTPRRQNPHMHLLEAFLAIRDLVDHGRGETLANSMLRLFESHFYDTTTGTLAEFYQDDWSPHATEGDVIEPGHHFEWSWLLSRTGHLAEANSLLQWGMSFGEDEIHGGFFDSVNREGQPLETTKRIWPVTECLKAWLARYERTGNRADRRESLRVLDFLFEHYLLEDGRWIEHLERDLTPKVTDMPGSTGYHITLALTEALRVLV